MNNDHLTTRHPSLRSLRRDLLDHVQEHDRLGPILHHPLAVLPIANKDRVRLANDAIADKEKAVVQARTERNWPMVFWLHERPYRLEALLELASTGELDDISATEWAELVRSAWTDTEFPSQQAPTVARLLYGSHPHGVNLMTMSSLEERLALGAAATDGRVTIFRGVGPDVDDPIGFSWTLDENQAAWFADRFEPGGTVVTAEVRLENVIAYLTCRDEEEILLDADTLTDLYESGQVRALP